MVKTIDIITGQSDFPAPFTHRVLILCHEKNIPYQLTKIDTEHKPDWFIEIAPLGQIPVMRIKDQVITDSRAIWEYLDSSYLPSLLPQNAMQCAQHRAWIGFADELAQAIAQFVKQNTKLIIDLIRLDELFGILDEQIKEPYFFGNDFSMVDIALISHILWIDAIEELALPCSILSKRKKVVAWLNAVKLRSSLRETMGANFAKNFIALLERYDLTSGWIR